MSVKLTYGTKEFRLPDDTDVETLLREIAAVTQNGGWLDIATQGPTGVAHIFPMPGVGISVAVAKPSAAQIW